MASNILCVQIVPAMLKLLGVQELPLELVTECLEKAWSSMAEYVKRDHTTVVWDLLQVSMYPSPGEHINFSHWFFTLTPGLVEWEFLRVFKFITEI